MGLVITFVLGLFIIAGAVLSHVSKHTHKVEQISVSVALGAMVGLAVLELIPEAYESIGTLEKGPVLTILIMLIGAGVGMGLIKILDLFIPEHDHAHGLSHDCSEENTMHIGIMATVAIILHNIIEGMAVYSVSSSSLTNGLLIALGVGLHNIPMGMMIASTLHHEKKAKRFGLLAALALSTFAGGLIMHFLWFLFVESVIGILVAVTLGMLIYIVVFELLPHILHGKQKKQSFLFALGGLVLTVISAFLG